MSTVLLLTGLKQEDIVHVSFHNRVYQVPFLVGLDHETKSVVVSIRGSITLRDMLTDMSADCDPLANDIGLPNVVAHRGMLKTAQYVQEQLEKGGYLQEAFGFHPDYDLVLIGHSLGAGVAALLGLLLRNSYPGVKCFLYAPPGGLLSDTAVRQTENFMMTIILGCDWVPRMSLANLDGLKASLLEALATCSTPKV